MTSNENKELVGGTTLEFLREFQDELVRTGRPREGSYEDAVADLTSKILTAKGAPPIRNARP